MNRTRELIQVGGLAMKAGLLDELGVPEGVDLQMGGPEIAKLAATLLGAFAHMTRELQELEPVEREKRLSEWRSVGVLLFRSKE